MHKHQLFSISLTGWNCLCDFDSQSVKCFLNCQFDSDWFFQIDLAVLMIDFRADIQQARTLDNRLLILQLTREELQHLIETAITTALAAVGTNQKEDRILSRKEIAELFGVSLTTINAWCRSGKLKRRYMGAKVYFLTSEVVALLKKN